MKKIVSIALLLFIVFLAWYFFIKSYDYTITFKVKTSPGTLFMGVEEWSLMNQLKDSIDYRINTKKSYSSINETINTNGLSLEVDWNFKSISDSISHVTVGFTQKKKSIYNRITIPFLDTKFEEITIRFVKDFKEDIENQLESRFQVKYIGVENIPDMTYAYIELKNIEMLKKAEKMMKYNDILLRFITQENIKDGKHPFLVIDKWDLNKNTIDFRFCFPIKLKDSMPMHKFIKYDTLKSKKALKAIYHGNYKTSDRGWFTLYEFAKRHNLEVENKPVEIFYNNPFYGGNELEWKAEIYLPIK